MIGLLQACARHGRLLLVAGLVAGIALPDLALAMRGLIAPLVVLLLFLAVLRIGPEGVRAGLSGLVPALRAALALQLALPLAAVLAFWAAGVAAQPLALATVLVLAAAPITGSPNIAIMTGGDPAPALRQLVVGTAVLPVTVLPVFWLVPAFGSPAEVLAVVLRLLALVGTAGGVALALRHRGVLRGGPRLYAAIDGLSALAMGVVVIGLMSAVGPALGTGAFAATLALAIALNLALQVGGALAARRPGPAPGDGAKAAAGRRPDATGPPAPPPAVPGAAAAPDSPTDQRPRPGGPGAVAAFGIVAGNRNIALFLGVLPGAVVDDLLLFIGCYQIPMYLTPLVMGPVYRRIARRAEP